MSEDRKISEPKFKPDNKYLHPRTWRGDAIPAGRIGPYGLGQTCWYVTVEMDGWHKSFAAETPERARDAAQAWIDAGCDPSL